MTTSRTTARATARTGAHASPSPGTRPRPRTGAFAALVALTAALLAGCSAPAPEATDAITLTDGWVKAADQGMTGAFGTLVNSTGADITLVSATSDVARVEMHEMAMADGQMVMRPKEGGLVVPAHGEHELAPGADHLMLMELGSPLAPGDEITITVAADDGTAWTLTLPVRTFTGADETYQSGSPSGSSSESE